ncbi:alpha/beta hydrolase [Geodermatophilus arenarius]|uniref:Alpha/beta fold hydrolase n=1 Tax=Geodermatophilus arenarius TaxID=1137990 RepID=A0ABV9LKN8_9ACTN
MRTASATLQGAVGPAAPADRGTLPKTVHRCVDVGSHMVAVTVRGTRPTPASAAAVIVTGAGDCQASWTPAADLLANHTRVITYDRAGLGRGRPGPAPTVQGYLDELQAVLDACLPEGPYVLVGHSLGGLIARLHAQQHPDRLAGLVQVDATPEQIADDRAVQVGFAVSGVLAHLLRGLAPFGVVRALLRLRALPLYPEQRTFEARLSAGQRREWVASVARSFGLRGAAGAELRSVLSCAREARRRTAGVGRPQFGDLPLVVLTSRAWGEEWVAMHRELATRSTCSIHRVFDDRRHNIHMAHPDAVAEAVTSLLRPTSLRPNAGPPPQ